MLSGCKIIILELEVTKRLEIILPGKESLRKAMKRSVDPQCCLFIYLFLKCRGHEQLRQGRQKYRSRFYIGCREIKDA